MKKDDSSYYIFIYLYLGDQLFVYSINTIITILITTLIQSVTMS